MSSSETPKRRDSIEEFEGKKVKHQDPKDIEASLNQR